jgi:hypothetical protein
VPALLIINGHPNSFRGLADVKTSKPWRLRWKRNGRQDHASSDNHPHTLIGK